MQNMSCEEWIKSRTDTPEKLGTETWRNYYNQIKQYQLRGISFNISTDTENEMFGDFLEKNGCNRELSKSATVRGATRFLLRNIDIDFEKSQMKPDAIRSLVSQCEKMETGTKSSSAKTLSTEIGRN